MLSILIPIYNFDVRLLVFDLYRQCEECATTFEILCFDDCSEKIFREENSELAKLELVNYIELKENIGRSKIRNELVKKAQYEYLLFLDCDSKINHDTYVKNYLDHLDPNTLLYGGRSYSPYPPAAPELFFHWFVGREREQYTVDERNIAPYHSFMTNNFLMPKVLFEQIWFDENLTQYGHEDTIFGLTLEDKSIAIKHLDNPLEHIGLERTDVFIKKNRQAIENLYYLSQKDDLIETTLLNSFKKSKQLGAHIMILKGYKAIESKIMNNFHSPNPSLKLFDFWKLAQLIMVDRDNK